ncbi:MAG: c-type cytochrome [Gammaproteobacteria bacterium]|nr:c-type cytochrome [Gammaproteobacteria bacterium]MDH3857116.1 c-type cytochrome [Gammaproteobacteria bacterium]
MYRALAYLLTAGLAIFTAPGAAEDFSDLVKRCEICHGQDGNSVLPIFPSISGFSYEGFLYTMEEYRENARIAIEFQRPGEPETVMRNIAQQLSGADLKGLANYFSKRKYIPRSQAFNPELASRGAILHENHCERCHLQNGTQPVDDAPILAGQWTPYLRLQFNNIQSGKRLVSRRMSNQLKKLDQADIEALLNFYASAS